MLDLVHTDIYENEELKHWGIIGMKWGIRRYQNPDGTLTPEGRERYGVKTVAETKKLSYSKKYESLKNKKQLNYFQQSELDSLEKGREYLLKNGSTNISINKLSKENIRKGFLASKFLMSTNYGKSAMLLNLFAGPSGPIVGSNYALANESDFLNELKNDTRDHKISMQTYIEDNWKKAVDKAKKYMESDKKYEKFINDHKYKEYKKDENDSKAFSKYYDPNIYVIDGISYEDNYVDYNTILNSKAQEILEKEYKDKYGK